MVHSSRPRRSTSRISQISRISLGSTLVSLMLAQIGIALPAPATWLDVKGEATLGDHAGTAKRTPLLTRSQVDRQRRCGRHDPQLAADQIQRHGGSRLGRLPLRCAPRHPLSASHPVAGTAGRAVAARLQRLIAE